MAEKTIELEGDIFLLFEEGFIPERPSLLHINNISAPFEKALKEYVGLDEKEFLTLLDSLPDANKAEPDFLEVKFEDLFNVPVTSHRATNQIAKMELEAGITSQGITVDLNTVFDEDKFELLSELPSLSFFFNVVIPTYVPPNSVELPPSVTPSVNLPTTPTITIDAAFTGGMNTEVLLNTQASVAFSGNIFTLGASLGNINAFFAPPARSGSSENRSIPGEVTLFTPEGNTFTFYLANVGGHNTGDFIYILNDAILTPPQAFITTGPDRIFTDMFNYSVTNNQNATNVGTINVQVIDDKPVATNQSAANTIAEEDISGTGSAQQPTLNQLTGSLIVPSIQATPPGPGDLSDNRFGANDGFVSDVSVAGGITTNLLFTIIVTDSQGNTLEVDKLTGNYTYTLAYPFHNTNNQPHNEIFNYQFTDFEGQTASANLTITSLDDAPIATEKQNSANETLLFVNGTEVATGNLITDDNGFGASQLGADGGTVFEVNGISAVAGIITASTTYGSITVYTIAQGGFVKGDYVYALDSAKTSPVNDALGQVIDTISYELMDDDGSTSTADLNITITLNQPPVANDDIGTTEQAVVLNVAASGVLTNDTVSPGDTKIAIAVNGVPADIGKQIALPSGALLTLNSNGSYFYDPNGNFLGGGSDNFTYTMMEAEGLTDTATVTITINAPQAVDDVGSTDDNVVLTVNAAAGLLTNDVKSPTDNVLLVATVNGSAVNVGGQILLASGALLTVNSDGSYSYDANDNFDAGGTDSFTYQAGDGVGSLSNVATVTITIIGDIPPVANDDVGTTHEGIPLVVNAVSGLLSNDTKSDAEDTFSIATINGAAINVGAQITLGSGALLTVNNDGSYTYDPNGKFASTGNDSFTYTASDGTFISNSATVTITVLVPPIVLDLNDDGIKLISAEDSIVAWDFYSTYHLTGWVSPEDGILIYDFDGDNSVTDVREFAFTAYAPEASSDLDALRIAFDTNGDGIFDEQDEHYTQFGVWQDKNSNGIVDEGEYLTLAERGIISLSLTSDHHEIILNGNTIFGFTTYQTQDGSIHIAADVGLKIGERLTLQDIVLESTEIDFSELKGEQIFTEVIENTPLENATLFPNAFDLLPQIIEQPILL